MVVTSRAGNLYAIAPRGSLPTKPKSAASNRSLSLITAPSISYLAWSRRIDQVLISLDHFFEVGTRGMLRHWKPKIFEVSEVQVVFGLSTPSIETIWYTKIVNGRVAVREESSCRKLPAAVFVDSSSFLPAFSNLSLSASKSRNVIKASPRTTR